MPSSFDSEIQVNLILLIFQYCVQIINKIKHIFLSVNHTLINFNDIFHYIKHKTLIK